MAALATQVPRRTRLKAGEEDVYTMQGTHGDMHMHMNHDHIAVHMHCEKCELQ